MKHWGIVVAVGLVKMALGSLLLYQGAFRPLGRFLALGGVAVFLGGMIGIIAYGTRHPALRCPHCGRGLYSRYLRGPGGGARVTGNEPVRCPYCGAIFQMWNMDREN